MQPPQIVNPVLGGQDVRNVAANQMDIRNADPRDIRLSNGYVPYQSVHNRKALDAWHAFMTFKIIMVSFSFVRLVHTSTFQWRTNVIQPETYFAKFPEMSVVIFAVFPVSSSAIIQCTDSRNSPSTSNL